MCFISFITMSGLPLSFVGIALVKEEVGIGGEIGVRRSEVKRAC